MKKLIQEISNRKDVTLICNFDNEAFFSLYVKKENCFRMLHLREDFLTYHMSYYQIGQDFGKKIQRKFKTILSDYNCFYQRPHNVLWFKSHTDVVNFTEKCFLDFWVAKKLIR